MLFGSSKKSNEKAASTDTTGKKKNKNKKDTQNELAIPKTVQDSIPYKRVYDDPAGGGVIETKDGLFTKSYLISDTNYSDAGDDKQEEILKTFEKILTSFSTDCVYEITVNNRNVDQEEFNKKVLIGYQNDKNDKLRAEHNELVLEKMQEGKNNLKSEKYLTIGVNCPDIDEALVKFASIEKELELKFKKINQIGLPALTLADRMEILHDIYNMGNEGDFAKFFDLNTIQAQGITTKDVIGPNSFNFKPSNYFQIDDRYARVIYLKSIPASLTSRMLEQITSIAANTLVSVYYDIQPQDKAVAFASAQVTNVGGEVIKAQKALSKAGADPNLISTKLDTARTDAKRMLTALTGENQSLFHVTVVMTIFADNKEDLELYTRQAMTRAQEIVCKFEVLNSQQEQGFISALPLGLNMIKSHRVMLTYDAATIQPFSTQELQIKNGFYYGLNQLSKNLIVYNRGISNNQNGVILGSPGGGKSFAAKMEMYQAFLNTHNTQIYIIDPEREYIPLANEFDGTVFSIAPGGTTHINPMDLDITKDSEGDPFAEKVDFVISIVESMLGGRAELNGYLKSIIDNTLQQLYAPYIQELERTNKTIDVDHCPTLRDFYNALKARKEPEAKNLAASIQMYCTGSLSIFAHHTNIDTNNRFIIYDTSHIGTNLKELGMQVCLNDIWNRMIANKKRNVRTWFYVDEFYLLLHQPSAARYLQMVWKRARKWAGTPTGITQNVSDLLATEEGNTILKTSDFALMLTQSFEDRLALAQIFNISEEQQEYITNASPGEGLIFTSRSIVPFENHVPTTSPIYKLLSTKVEDAEAITKE